MTNKRVQYIEGITTQAIPNPTTGLQYLRRNAANTGWEFVTLSSGGGSEALADVLSLGNTTDGYDIILSVGDALASADGYVNISGNLIVSNGIDVGNHKITSVATPTNSTDAVNKTYVDTRVVSLTVSAPADVDKSTALVGTSTTSAKSDHKHNISTAAATSVGSANLEGTATSLARSDHKHAVTDLFISAQTGGDILYFNGANWTRLGSGADGYILTSHGTATIPSWKINPALALIPSTLNQTAYVDASYSGSVHNGSDISPYTTIAAALATLTSGVIIIAPGVYGEASIAIPKGKKISIRSLSTDVSITSITNQIIWTMGNNDELHINGVDLPGGISIKDGDAGTGNVLLTLQSLTCGNIINGNSGSAAHTHIIEITACGRVLGDFGISTLSDMVIGGVNINGKITLSQVYVSGNTFCDSMFGYNIFLGDGTSHNWNNNSLLTDTCEFGTSVSITMSSDTLYMDDSTSYYFQTVTLTGGTVRILHLPATDLNLSGETQGSTAYFNGTNWVQLPPSQDGYVLTTHGVGANPTWKYLSTVATDINISGEAKGDLLYFNGTNWVNIPAGNDGYVLTTHGAGANPTWGTDYSGNSIRFSNSPALTGTIRLPNTFQINARNSTNTGDFQLATMISTQLYLGGETLQGGFGLGGGNTPIFGGSANGSQTVIGVTTVGTGVGFLQFSDVSNGGNCTLQIHATGQNTGRLLSINSQMANVTGGALYLTSGNSSSGSGPQGRVGLGMGGWINGVPSGTGVQMIELANLGTGNAPASVLSLCLNASITTTQVPNGNGLIYLATAGTAPTSNPTGGLLMWANSTGGLLTRSTFGTMDLGDNSLKLSLAGSSIAFTANNIGIASLSNASAYSVFTLTAGSTNGAIEIAQNGGGTATAAAFQVQATTTSPAPIILHFSGQLSTTGNGGDVVLSSGGTNSSTSKQGRLSLSLGSYYKGLANGQAEQFLDAVQLGTAGTPRIVLGLLGTGATTTTQMPTGTGSRVIYLASAAAAPTVSPVGGAIVYANSTGALMTRSTAGTMDLGDNSLNVSISGGQIYFTSNNVSIAQMANAAAFSRFTLLGGSATGAIEIADGGAGTTTAAAFQVQATSTSPAPIVLHFSGQLCTTGNGGDATISSGGTSTTTAKQGRLALSLGSYYKGLLTGIAAEQVLDAVQLGTAVSPRVVLGLLGTGATTTTQMPTGTGSRVIYLASAATTPTVSPVGGAIMYASSSGEICTRATDGYMRLGDNTTPIVLGASSANVAICSAPASYQAMIGGTFIATATTIPSGNPTSGFYLYVDPADNKLKCRGSSGTVTTLALP